MSWLSFFVGYSTHEEFQEPDAEDLPLAEVDEQHRQARAAIEQWRRRSAQARRQTRRIFRQHPELEQMRIEIDKKREDLRNRLMQGDYQVGEWEALRKSNLEYSRLMQQAASGHSHSRRQPPPT